MKQIYHILVFALMALMASTAQAGTYNDEPTVITCPEAKGSNLPNYSFIANNIKVEVTMGAMQATYFGVNAGNSVTFTALEPIKAVVINGYVKKGFEAECNHGDIAYVDASEDAVENDPVVVITDVDSKSVTIDCVKQLRCYNVEFYFDENPDIEGIGDDEEEYTYEWEPDMKSNLNITFDEMSYGDFTEYVGFDYIDMYFSSEDYEMDLLILAPYTPGTVVAPGTYKLSFDYDDNTIVASMGGNDYEDDPSYIATGFEYDEEYGWYYTSAYYLVDGALTVSADPKGVKMVPNATTAKGSTVKATYVGKPVDYINEDEEDAIASTTNDQRTGTSKRLVNGRIQIERNGMIFDAVGTRIK